VAKKAPAKAAPAKAAVKKAAPAKKVAPLKAAPAKTAAATKSPAKAGPAKAAPAKAAPAKAAPAKASAKAPAPAVTPPASAAPVKGAAKKTASKIAAAPPVDPDLPEVPAPPTRAELLAAAASSAARKSSKEAVPEPTKPGATVLAGERPWAKQELAKVRSSLEAQVRDLRGEINEAEESWAALQRDSGEGAGDDQADAGTKTFEREHEMSLAANSRDLLSQVERALQRLDDGTYPICESCGNPIGKARLQAFPRATLCVSCKQREERR
jgi:RNA polymerase-binding protein DksA